MSENTTEKKELSAILKRIEKLENAVKKLGGETLLSE